jgi:hypothetical protein
MKSAWIAPVWLAVMGGACGASAATPAPASADPEAAMVQELVVTSHAGGPAWWTVSNAGATVYVLGVPEALPKTLKWDTTLTRRRLQGARELIAPTVITAGLGDIFPLLNARKHFRSKGPMEATLPADLRGRYLADRASLTHDSRAYSGWTPLVAGLLMVSDFRGQAGLAEREPAATVIRLAGHAGVRVVPAGTYRITPLVRAAETGLAADGPACLTDALDEIEAGPAQVNAAAAGWAHGDVGEALSQQRGYEKCLASLPEGADLASRAMTDTTAAIAAALATPGHDVAVVNLRTLLARDGVLQRLQARGFRIGKPNQ